MHTTVDPLMIAEGVLIVSVNDDTAGTQSAAPSGSSVVNVIVTEPAVMSAGEGVNDVAVPNTLEGLNDPVPLVLHVADVAPPPIEPPNV